MKKHTKLLVAIFAAGLATANITPSQAKDRDIIFAEAAKYNIPRDVIYHVAKKESTFRCSPGNPRYHGPLQISPRSAAALGYRTSEGKLNNCRAGLKYGLRHLALCVRKVGNNPKAAARCHAGPARYGVVVRWRG